MRINKKHEYNSQGGLLWRWEVNPALLRGRDSKKHSLPKKRVIQNYDKISQESHASLWVAVNYTVLYIQMNDGQWR